MRRGGAAVAARMPGPATKTWRGLQEGESAKSRGMEARFGGWTADTDADNHDPHGTSPPRNAALFLPAR
jgi:hypothetical protein